MNLDPIIRAVQAALGVDSDGAAGPATWQAIYAGVLGHAWADTQLTERHTVPGVADSDLVDARSEAAIATLLPPVRPYARALLHAAAQQGITLIVTSGTRSYAEQDKLFHQRPVVTKAPAGYSNHNFGLAFDVTIFRDGQPVWESPAYKAVGAIGKALGLTWGGDWTSIDDEPHFELHPRWAAGMSESAMLAELRNRHDSGQSAFA